MDFGNGQRKKSPLPAQDMLGELIYIRPQSKTVPNQLRGSVFEIQQILNGVNVVDWGIWVFGN